MCLSIFCFFSKFPRHLVHLFQPTYIYSPFNTFNILVQILSSLAAFPHFNHRTAAATFVNEKDSSFPKSILLHVSAGVAVTGFNKSSKYYLHCKRISFSFLRMFPIESLMKLVVIKLFPRKLRKVCQNALFAYEYLESNRRPNFSQMLSLDIFTARVTAFCASEYRDCKLGDNVFCNKTLKASFCCSDSLFNILAPQRCSFLTTLCHPKHPILFTAFNN